MTSSAPLIQRLQTHQVNARRMLSPGLKDPARQQRSISPVLDGWGGQKYTKIAQNMRFLSEERLGHLTPEKINLIGRDLPAKFSDPAAFLHVRPPTARDDSIWSDVEKTFPGAGHSVADTQSASDPGTLRQGSIIQRFQTFPKPGQSIESFKEQMQSRAVSPKPAVVPPARPVPKPGDRSVRRYSRVEEVTGKESSPPESPAEPPATIQRQPEPTIELKPSEPVPPLDVPEAMDLPRQAAVPPAVDQPVAEDEQPAPAPVQPEKSAAPSIEPPKAVSSDRPDATPDLAMPVKAAPPPKQPQEPVLPKREMPTEKVKVAQPVVRSQPQASQPPEAQLPRAMPTPKKTVSAPKLSPLSRPVGRARSADAGSVRTVPKPSRPPTAATIQRQEETSPTPQEPQPPTMEVASPKVGMELPERSPDPDPEATMRLPEPDQTAPPPPEAPLLLHLAQRKTAPEQIRFVTPKVVKSDAQRPVMIQRDSLRLGRLQPSQPGRAAPRPDRGPTSLHPQPLARPAADLGPSVSRLSAEATSSAPKMEMPVARMVEQTAPQARSASSASSPTTAPQSTVPNNQPPPAAPTLSAAATGPASNVVQRLWDGHSPPVSQSSGKAGSAAESGESDGAGLDLDKLAEQVFPIVKRLIEIETERSSGYLR